MTAETAEHEAHAVNHHQVARLVFDRSAGETICFVVAASVIRAPHHREARDDCERIQIARDVCLPQRLAETTFHRELQRVPDARRRVIRIEFDRAYEMMFGGGPGKVATDYGLAQRRVAFGQILIELD